MANDERDAPRSRHSLRPPHPRRTNWTGDHIAPLEDPELATDAIPRGQSRRSRKARRKRIWRRIRRTAYIVATAVVVAAAGAFAVGYMTLSVPNPQEVANQTKQSTILQYADGSELTRIVPDSGNRIMIQDLNRDVSESMREATLAAEDASFYQNRGFDVLGIARAAWSQLTGGVGGGSTLTQQYIKLTTRADELTLSRKFKEVVLAFKMTNEQPKEEILKAYLNTAYYGRGAHGIHAAAQAYFGKLPKDLDPSESAVLAGMVQRPTENDPAVNPEQGQRRWDYVVDQMVRNRFVPPEERAAMRLPQTRDRAASRGDRLTGPLFHIREKVLEELELEGITEDDLQRNGHTVVTNIDRDAQQAAENAVNEMTAGQSQNLRSALVAVEPASGAVKAYHGGDGQVGGFNWAEAPRPPGSAFAPFAVLAGLDQGVDPGTVFDGSSPQEIDGSTYRNTGAGCPVPLKCSVLEAMETSADTALVNLAAQVGPERVRDMAVEAGIPGDIGGRPAMRDARGTVDPGIALGMYPVSTADMARAYATLANDGAARQPRFVQKVVDRTGADVATFESASTGGLSDSNLARNVTDVLRATAADEGDQINDGRPVAAKSGMYAPSSSGVPMTVSTAGYTPQIATAVAVSASDGNNRPESLQDGGVGGESLSGKVWRGFMNDYLRDLPPQRFTPSDPVGRAEPSATEESVTEEPTTVEETDFQDPSGSPSEPSAVVPPRKRSAGNRRRRASRAC